MNHKLSILRCESCGMKPFSPPSHYGEVWRDYAKRWHFLCAECSTIEPIKPLRGIRAELALHELLLNAKRSVPMDESESIEMERNTLIAFHRH